MEFSVTELEDPDELAGKCSGATCCLAAGNIDDGFTVDELEEPDTLAGKCSGATCCLAVGELEPR